jgi:gliding motility-associated protein GldC
MKKSDIHFSIELDEKNIPEQIHWEATDNPNEGITDTKAIFIGVWDHYHKSSLALPLWTKDMEVPEMKRFSIEMMGSLADTIARATGDLEMAQELDNLCIKFTKKLQAELKAQQQQQGN